MQQSASSSPSKGASTTQFQCLVVVSDLTLSVMDPARQSLWEEVRCLVSHDGREQKSRWLALPLAPELRARQRDATNTPKTIFDDGLISAAELPIKRGTRDVHFSGINDCSFVVEFTTDPGRDIGTRRAVKAKQVRLFELGVECHNEGWLGSLTGGPKGDQAPTSANVEALVAACQKGSASMSAWAKNAFLKIKTSGDRAQERKQEDAAALHKAIRAFNQAAITTTQSRDPRGLYATVVSGVDPSEAYNAPGGKKRYTLMLKPRYPSAPLKGPGAPVFLSFVMAATLGEGVVKPSPVPRNYHRFVVVVDQVVLDLSEAQRFLPPKAATSAEKSSLFKEAVAAVGSAPPPPSSSSAPPRRINGYGFGVSTNSRENDGFPALRSFIASEDVICAPAGTTVRTIDFSGLHAKQNEGDRTVDDLRSNPTNVCVVSTMCHEGCRERVGSRALSYSRFKADPDGLCKPSYKCQLLVYLRRQVEGGDVEEEPSLTPVDLASVLNEEYYPPHVRRLEFTLGEIVYVRIRRFCFVDAAWHSAPLLMPFDSSDNEDVVIQSPSNERVSTWRFGRAATATSAAAATTAAMPLGDEDEDDETDSSESQSPMENGKPMMADSFTETAPPDNTADSTTSASPLNPENPFRPTSPVREERGPPAAKTATAGGIADLGVQVPHVSFERSSNTPELWGVPPGSSSNGEQPGIDGAATFTITLADPLDNPFSAEASPLHTDGRPIYGTTVESAGYFFSEEPNPAFEIVPLEEDNTS